MKKTFTKLVVAALLVLPALANAELYSGNQDLDIFNFELTGTSDVEVKTTWSDMLLTDKKKDTLVNNGELFWSLTNNDNIDQAQAGDIFNGKAATGHKWLSFASLVAGSYKLLLVGSWESMDAAKGYDHIVGGKVNIADRSFHVTAVPEPETYAMLLAGLMMMGTIARRRSAK
jgi:hypothetical protein